MRTAKLSDQDRFLIMRGDYYHYKRRIPVNLIDVLKSGTHIRKALKTSDLVVARKRRDAIEAADNEYWSSLVLENEADKSLTRYKAAIRRAEVLGFEYRSSEQISQMSIDEIVARVTSVMGRSPSTDEVAAVLGGETKPKTTVSDAFDLYLKEIAVAEVSGKSQKQKELWENTKRRAINTFIEVIEDKAIEDITRDDARKLYTYWLKKIVPSAPGEKRYSNDSGNRCLGDMRQLYKRYFEHLGEPDRTNPFDGLGFRNGTKGSKTKKRVRPPFSTGWIKSTFLQQGKLANLNEQARGVFLALIETGARLSEICNLTEDFIILNDAVPHLRIEPREDPDDPREIKTQSSIRTIPLVGVAHEVFKKFPKGFPRYADKGASLSATLGKFLTENELLETDGQVVYSLRHTFEDRMKEAGLGDELRRILMGHTLDRVEYGSGGALKWRRDELMKIVLPFDPSIV